MLSAHLEANPGAPLLKTTAVENARRALRRLSKR